MAEISQEYESTRRGVKRMRGAVAEASGSLQRGITALQDLKWSGETRQVFDQLARDWYSAMMDAISVVGSYADEVEKVVEEQQAGEVRRSVGGFPGATGRWMTACPESPRVPARSRARTVSRSRRQAPRTESLADSPLRAKETREHAVRSGPWSGHAPDRSECQRGTRRNRGIR